MIDNPVEQACNAIPAQPCVYTIPPLSFLGGHQFCPCILKAIRIAYVGGYKAAKIGHEPEVGIEVLDPRDEK